MNDRHAPKIAKRERKGAAGSITVEAAMIIPIFLLMMLPFLFLIRRLTFCFMFESGVQDALTLLSVISYVAEKAENRGIQTQEQKDKQKKAVEDREEKAGSYSALLGTVSRLFSSGSGESDALDELLLNEAGMLYMWTELCRRWDSATLEAWGVEGGWAGISMADSEFFYSDEKRRGLMKADIRISWASPVSFWTPEEGRICKVTHAFLGEKDAGSGRGQRDESEEDAETVYRIGEGTKYHTGSCFLIDKEKVEISSAAALARGIPPCSLCGGGDVTVYMT